MGFWSKLLGRKSDEPLVITPEAVVIRRAELVEGLRVPTEPNFSDAPQAPCDRCGQVFSEVLITTGGPLGDPDVWRDHPVAVDGWACTQCGVFRYPRRMTPDRIHQLSEEGAAHGRAGRVAEAELCFARITWDWPGYFPGHINYAEATRARIAAIEGPEDALHRRLSDRMVTHYEAAITAYEREPKQYAVAPVARAYIVLARVAIQRRAFDRADRMLERCLSLPGLAEDAAAEAQELARYVAERHDLFEEAAKVIEPYVHLSDRRGRSIETGTERKALVEAIEKLEAHWALAPASWRAGWLMAKGKGALGDRAGARAAWRRAYEIAPEQKDVARDYVLDLLEQGAAAEGLPIARAIAAAHPEDATLWCNLAVTELLAGDLAAATKSLDRSLTLDPKDPIAHAVQKKIASFRAGAPIPRTLGELSQ
ncbi:MAG: tetratricopeptide repeat protein [Minicystis sp.]